MNIEIALKEEHDALCEFNQNKISENLNHYLVESLEHQSLKELTITITGTNNSKLEKIIHKYYQEKYYFLKKVDNIDNYIRLILFLIGIIFILISEQFSHVLSEIFLIAGWVVLWETVYDILFKAIERKRKANLYKILANSKIIIKKEKEK